MVGGALHILGGHNCTSILIYGVVVCSGWVLGVYPQGYAELYPQAKSC